MGASTKILIVDDDVERLALMAEIVERKVNQATVFKEQDGADGLRCALAEQPDLIITDFLMPAVNGIEFVGKLREVGVKTRVIFASALASDPQYTMQFAKLGACDVLQMPCSPDELGAAVKRALALGNPLSVSDEETAGALDSALRQNARLRLQLDLERKEVAKVEDQLSSLSRLERELRRKGDEKAELEKRIRSQCEENVELRERLRGSSRRELLQNVSVRLVYLLAVVGITLLFYRSGMVERGSQLYLFPVLLFLLLVLPFDRIKSLIGKFRKMEASAEFVSHEGEREDKGSTR